VGIEEDQSLKLGGKASNSAAPMRLRSTAAVLSAQQFRQLAEVRRQPPRLVPREQLGR
jgi:hypothetical protein